MAVQLKLSFMLFFNQQKTEKQIPIPGNVIQSLALLYHRHLMNRPPIVTLSKWLGLQMKSMLEVDNWSMDKSWAEFSTVDLAVC
jgi:hypothetical protein